MCDVPFSWKTDGPRSWTWPGPGGATGTSVVSKRHNCVGRTRRRSTWRFYRLKSVPGLGLRRLNLPWIRVGFDASSERRPRIMHRPGRAGASRGTAISHDVLATPATTSIASIARDGPRTVSCPSPPDGPRAQLARLGGFSDASFQPFQGGHWSSRFLLRRFEVQCPPSSVGFGRSTSNGGFIGAERNP